MKFKVEIGDDARELWRVVKQDPWGSALALMLAAVACGSVIGFIVAVLQGAM